MDISPTLTIAPALPAAAAPPLTAASLPVDPTTATGVVWYVVPASAAHRVPRAHHHPHAA